jgi:hypothetical protein
MGRCAPVGASVAELGPAAGASAAGMTGGATGAGATGVVAAGCAHCIGVVVAGLGAALGAALGLERMSEEVARGESRVPARGFLPRLAAEEAAARGLPRGVLLGIAGMKVRSGKGEAMVVGRDELFAGFGQKRMASARPCRSRRDDSQFIQHFPFARSPLAFFLRRLFISRRRSVESHRHP